MSTSHLRSLDNLGIANIGDGFLVKRQVIYILNMRIHYCDILKPTRLCYIHTKLSSKNDPSNQVSIVVELSIKRTVVLQTWKFPREARMEAPTHAENIRSEVFPPVTTLTFILEVVLAVHSVVNLSPKPCEIHYSQVRNDRSHVLPPDCVIVINGSGPLVNPGQN